MMRPLVPVRRQPGAKPGHAVRGAYPIRWPNLSKRIVWVRPSGEAWTSLHH